MGTGASGTAAGGRADVHGREARATLLPTGPDPGGGSDRRTPMRHGTTIALAALLLLIVVAAAVQLSRAAAL